jgi:hypothetical protein
LQLSQLKKYSPKPQANRLIIKTTEVHTMTKSLLSSLRVTSKPSKATDLLGKRKERLLKRLEEQRQLAEGMINDELVVIHKEKWVTNNETGLKELKLFQRKTAKWFFQNNGTWFFEIRIGKARLELEKNCTVIELSSKEDLLESINIITEAIKIGELDKQIQSAETGFSKKK